MKKVVLQKTEEPSLVRRMSGSSNRMAGIVLMSYILVALSIPNLAHAAVFKCPSADVVCLIDAINVANSNGEKDTIKLSSGTYELTEVDNDIDGQNGLPSITSEITIKGVGVDATTIAGGPRIFHVAIEGILNLVRLTIEGGFVSDVGGGCIYNAGTLTIRNSAIAGCRTDFGLGGGGILNNGGKLSIRTSDILDNFANDLPRLGGGGILNICGQVIVKNSTVVDNISESDGGGIVSSDAFCESEDYDPLLFIKNSTIDGNASGPPVGGGGGGGIFAAGEATIINSTISNNLSFEGVGGGAIVKIGGTLILEGSDIDANETEGPGGGILNIGGTATIKNTFISDNIAGPSIFISEFDGVGGGIFNFEGEMSIKNTTISSNTANSPFGGDGGGVFNFEGEMSIKNTTISSNTAYTEGGGIFNDVSGIVKLRDTQLRGNTAPVGPDCSGEILLLGEGNVIGDTSDCTVVSP